MCHRQSLCHDPHQHKTEAKRFFNVLRVCCGRTGDGGFYDEEHEHDYRFFDISECLGNRPFYWTTALQNSFREELEKYVVFIRFAVPGVSFLPRFIILGYLMLSTDRGLDNFMIKMLRH